ncbi:MAG: hypothetical protein AB7T59_12465 [Hyphomonadaceae bacterium]
MGNEPSEAPRHFPSLAATRVKTRIRGHSDPRFCLQRIRARKNTYDASKRASGGISKSTSLKYERETQMTKIAAFATAFVLFAPVAVAILNQAALIVA